MINTMTEILKEFDNIVDKLDTTQVVMINYLIAGEHFNLKLETLEYLLTSVPAFRMFENVETLVASLCLSILRDQKYTIKRDRKGKRGLI